MDFHSLTRRELQALCKKNKIPANLTNVAMADALQSLDFVDGMDELLKPCESETADSSMESPARSETVTSVPRTGRQATQQKTIKHDSETMQTSTRSRCRTRGTVVIGVDEPKNDVHQTPALPTTRRRAAVTSVQAKLEYMMKECEPKGKIEDQIEVEKKDVPKTPAAVRTSQRKVVKAKSSVRPVYSTRRSARLAGTPMQESSTLENENPGSIPFDAFPEETDENLEVDSEQYSVHKNEELDKNGNVHNDIDLTTSESGEINNEPNVVTAHDLNTLVENDIAKEDDVHLEGENNLVVVAIDAKAEANLEEVAAGHNSDGSDDVQISEKKVDESGKEMTSGGMQCLEDVSGAKVEVSGEEPSEEPEIDHVATNADTVTVVLDVAGEKQGIEEPELDFADVDNAFDALEATGEEPNKESEVAHADASVNSAAVAEGKQPMEEPEIDFADANADNAFAALEATGEEPNKESEDADASVNSTAVAEGKQPMEESELDLDEARVDRAAADVLEVAGEEPMEESEFDLADASVDRAAADVLEVTEEEPMEESEVDHVEVNMYSPALSLEVDGEEPMEEYGVDHVETNVDNPLEVAGEEEPMEESEVDHHEANGDSAAHALPPSASVIPSALVSTDLEHITQTSCLTPVKSSAATNIGLIHVTDDKENIDSCGRNLVLTKEKLKKTTDIARNDRKQSFQDLSLRKLTKMLKELKITKESSENEIAKTKVPSSRPALQRLAENRCQAQDQPCKDLQKTVRSMKLKIEAYIKADHYSANQL